MLKTVWGTDWRYLLAILAITSCYIGEVSGVFCPHCNKDFKSLGRHIWRCKSKVEINTAQGITTQPSGSVTNEIEVPQRSLANNGGSVQPTKEVELIFIELSSLGFYMENINDFKNFLKDLNLNPSQILDKCIETCIRCSYYIYNRRLKDWTIPELLLFV